jgi:hypothetical protein
VCSGRDKKKDKKNIVDMNEIFRVIVSHAPVSCDEVYIWKKNFEISILAQSLRS